MKPSGITDRLRMNLSVASRLECVAEILDEHPDQVDAACEHLRYVADELRKNTDRLAEHLEKIGRLPPQPDTWDANPTEGATP